ncbi:MAG: hypothetical protein ACLRMZ_13190 [Blautia marasmi]
MQAALGALERGHKVILCEASDSLGKHSVILIILNLSRISVSSGIRLSAVSKTARLKCV